MKDKTIINIISKIYLIIGSFLSFILLSLITIFIILQHGLCLDNLSISNITVKNFYIKWNDKLNISIDELEIHTLNKDSGQKKFKIDDIRQYLTLSSEFFLLTESVAIRKFEYGQTCISLKHSDKGGYITAKSPTIDFNSHFIFRDEALLFTINKLTTLNNKANISGKIIFDIFSNKIYSKLNILINNDADLTLYAVATQKKLKYTINSNKDIQHIHQLVELFELPKEIHFWAVDAIDAPSLTIKKIKGFIDYDHFDDAYKNLYILATLNKLNYMYNPKLDTIHTKKTDLEFLKGVLYIRPKEAYSYGMYLNKSWLKIDFTQPQEILTLYLLFDGQLNKNMLHILNTYHIKLPFLQHSGNVKTDLVITVNLRTIKIDAHGTFFTKKANFDYLGLNIDISDTLIKLDNYDIDIPQMKARYKNIAKADVTVKYNAKKATGKIDFFVNSMKINKNQHLITRNKKLHIIYTISPLGDTIHSEKSIWKVNDLIVTIDPMQLPFNLKKLQVDIPTTYFSIKNIADGYITGKANIKEFTANLKTDLLHFKYNDIKLSQSNTPLNIQYNNKLFIKSTHAIFFTISGSPYKIKKLDIEIDSNKISLKKTTLNVSNYITSKIQANYYLKNKKANIILNNITLIDPKNKNKLYYKKKLNIAMRTKKKHITITSKELDADLVLYDNKWVLNLNSLKTIAKNSKLLRQYKLNDGQITFYKKNKDKYTKFIANINYPYKILTDLNKPIDNYKIKGYITKKQTIYATINNNLTIKASDTININLKNSGISSEELFKFIEMISKENNSAKTNKQNNIKFTALNSYIYIGNNRYILSDTITLQYYNNILTAQLQYKDGKAGFEFKNNNFHLYGQNFNDTFMEKLFTLSKFKGGSLDFIINGKPSDYTGTFFINNTTIQDYVILNNILAFINTVPSLATFSLPGYAKNGLLINNAYMKFHLKNHIFNISDIYIGSKELKIFGQGIASVKYNNIDITLNLKTEIAKNLSKIPVVGYLIFDGKSLSTTLRITGELTNPQVQTMLARDVAVAPINIIQRTLTLPYHLFKDVSQLNNPLDLQK